MLGVQTEHQFASRGQRRGKWKELARTLVYYHDIGLSDSPAR